MVFNLKKKIILVTLILLPLNLFSNIIYDKNNIIITDIDLVYYKQLYFENFTKEINNSSALKNIVILKNVINNFEKKNPEFIKKIDEILVQEYGKKTTDIPIARDFMRYFKIRNEFIIEYFNINFNLNDLENIFNSIDKFELPISDNDCLTIIKLVNFKSDDSFLNEYYNNLRKKTKKYETIINDKKYDICINSKTHKFIENKILNYIEFKTEKDFEKFVYEQQS